MRYGIFSDIHSNLEAFDTVIQAYKKEKIDKYLCGGDVVGYASNPAECIEKISRLAEICVAGNHDWASVNLLADTYFNPLAKEAIEWTRRNLDEQDRIYLRSLKLVFKNEDLTLVHGTLDNPGDFGYMTDEFAARKTFALLENNICFVGHSHVAGIFIMGKDDRIHYQEHPRTEIKEANKYIINVGSVGQPRDGNPCAAFCIYDTLRKEVLIKRINYDIKAVREKIISAGLPMFLGDRLLMGM